MQWADKKQKILDLGFFLKKLCSCNLTVLAWVMCYSRTWFTGGLGSAGLIVGLHDLRNLFQLKWLHVSLSLNAPATPSQSNKSPKGCLVLQWRWPSEQSKPGGSGRARCLQERSVKFQGRAESVTPAGVCLFLDTPITNYKTQPHRKICAYRFLLKSAVLVLMLQWTSQQDTQKPLGLLRLWF